MASRLDKSGFDQSSYQNFGDYVYTIKLHEAFGAGGHIHLGAQKTT